MGPPGPQAAALIDGPIVTAEAMAGQAGYLPVDKLLAGEDDKNWSEYDSAEAWYRYSLHLKMFSRNQISYRTRLKMAIEATLVERYNIVWNYQNSGIAADRLASYYFKRMYEIDNNFQN